MTATQTPFLALISSLSSRGGVSARRYFIVALTVVVAIAPTLNAASARSIPLIRDTEIENLLSDYARPIFRAAGQDRGRIEMRIVRSEAFNAFVIDGTNVYMHTGALTQAETPNEIIGIIAHETGHITGGHLAAFRARVARDQTKSLLAQILGIGLMVAGGIAGGDTGREVAGAGTGVLYGGNELITRSLLAERRSQESAADQAGLQFLRRTKQSGKGMLTTFERFARQEMFSNNDAFLRSHPVATTRLAQLRRVARQSPYFETKDPPNLQLRHDLMRAKLRGYLLKQRAFNYYPTTDTSLPARYGRAIATFFTRGIAAALPLVDDLIASQPRNPYFRELRGDLLMRAGKVNEAIPSLRRALKIGGNPPLMQIQLAQALLNTRKASRTNEAIRLLKSAVNKDKNAAAFAMLAKAYSDKGNVPLANAMTAQQLFLVGNVDRAKIFAKRAEKKLRRGSTEWVNNDDIIQYQK